VLKGFRDFIARGNVIDLAVAVVIGAAFTAIVNTVVTAFVNPLIGFFLQVGDLNEALILKVPTLSGGVSEFQFGAILAAVITFVATAAVVYFAFVLPMNHYRERQAAKNPVVEEESLPTEQQLLIEIRDLLRAQKNG
jgi:large conductance mechanosensitive channel